jgi:hypothetical protein
VCVKLEIFYLRVKLICLAQIFIISLYDEMSWMDSSGQSRTKVESQQKRSYAKAIIKRQPEPDGESQERMFFPNVMNVIKFYKKI